MKRLFAILVICVFMTTGCAMSTGPKQISPEYQAYTQTIQAQLTAEQKPLVDIGINEEGKITGIIVNQPVKYIHVEQKNPHPAWAAFSGVVRVAGTVGSIWAVGEAVTGIVNASTGDNINSNNNMTGNEGEIGQDYTSTTETITTTTSEIEANTSE